MAVEERRKGTAAAVCTGMRSFCRCMLISQALESGGAAHLSYRNPPAGSVLTPCTWAAPQCLQGWSKQKQTYRYKDGSTWRCNDKCTDAHDPIYEVCHTRLCLACNLRL